VGTIEVGRRQDINAKKKEEELDLKSKLRLGIDIKMKG
jgi:hypothetical protein